MSSTVVFAICLLAGAAHGQWSEPVVLASGLQHYAAGPWLVPQRGDSIWVFWIAQTVPPQLCGRCFDGDTWRDTEVLARNETGIYFPAGIQDESGGVLAAWYEGSHPTAAAGQQDSWGIYTSACTDSGWTRPVLCFPMLAERFPTNIRLGRVRDGSVGMMWEESSGGMNAMESVMVSRRGVGGWTPPVCIAPGRYPDRACLAGALVPGDSTLFLAAFSRWTYPDSSAVEVWDLNDSLAHQPAQFSGSLPMLARGEDTRFLVFCVGDSVMGSVNRGQGWSQPELVADNSGWGGANLCADPESWGWTCWPDSQHRSVLASYNRCAGWSVPETVATSAALGSPRIASDGNGTLYCTWFDHAGGGAGQLRCAHRLGRPGVDEASALNAPGSTPNSTIVGRVLHIGRQLTDNSPQPEIGLYDAGGRRVMSLNVGPNDVSRLAPGVYFVRSAGSGGRSTSAVRKVVIQR